MFPMRNWDPKKSYALSTTINHLTEELWLDQRASDFTAAFTLHHFYQSDDLDFISTSYSINYIYSKTPFLSILPKYIINIANYFKRLDSLILKALKIFILKHLSSITFSTLPVLPDNFNLFIKQKQN